MCEHSKCTFAVEPWDLIIHYSVSFLGDAFCPLDLKKFFNLSTNRKPRPTGQIPTKIQTIKNDSKWNRKYASTYNKTNKQTKKQTKKKQKKKKEKKKIEPEIKKLPAKEILGLDDFTSEFFQNCKDELTPIYHNLFPKNTGGKNTSWLIIEGQYYPDTKIR